MTHALTDESKNFLKAIFGAKAAQATVEWWRFDQTTGKAVGRSAARAADATTVTAGDSVYWSVGLMKNSGLSGRSNANVESVHALVADDVGTKVDQGLVDVFMPTPTAIVNTSVGNHQYVWAVAGGMTIAQHARLWAGMEALLGRRMDGNDPSHLFRAPQGVNGKPGKQGYPVTLVVNSNRVFEFTDLEALLPVGAPGAPAAKAPGTAPQQATLGEVQRVLDLIDNRQVDLVSYDDWIAIGIAVWGAVGEDGYEAWVEWSYRSPIAGLTYTPEEKWTTFPAQPTAGFGALEIMAKRLAGVGALAGAVFDDGSPGLDAAVEEHRSRAAKGLDEFWAHAPSGKFIDERLGSLIPAVSLDGMFPVSGVVDAKGKNVASSRVLRTRRVIDQMSWIPGRGKIIQHTEVKTGGVEASPGNTIFNLYEGPRGIVGNAQMSLPWTAHVRKLYPGDAEHIFDWFAHRVQFPGVKINHALVIGGDPGIGKDTLIEPLVHGVGAWNFADVKPADLLARFNGHRRAVVLRVNEVYDLGEGLNRTKFYALTKTLIAAPPETLQVEQKGVDVYSIPNVVGVIMTSNHKLDGLYLPPDDRRHYVAWSKATAGDFKAGYFADLWKWLRGGGVGHVVAFLKERDLSGFDAKAPPKQTRAFISIAAVSQGASNEEVSDVIGAMGNPDVFSWGDFLNQAPGGLHDMNKANPRKLAGCIEQEGFEKVLNPANKHGRWSITRDVWVTLYGRRSMTPGDQIAAAERWVDKKRAETAKFGA